MTDNFDEFDQDQFDEIEIDEGLAPEAEKKTSPRDILNKPVVKLGIIVGVVGLAIAGALGAFTSDEEIQATHVVSPPSINEAPGGDVTPFFAEQNKMANEQRVKEAMATQGSAMPTPIGKSVDSIDIDAISRQNAMEEFNAQTERLQREWRAEQKRNDQKMLAMQQQIQQQPFDDSLAQAMQQQMSTLMQSWEPQGMKVVSGVGLVSTDTQKGFLTGKSGMNPAIVPVNNELPAGATPTMPEPKTIVPAGTVNYAQLLIEANSDVPGPVMVQILSGPLSGARAIGTFKVMYEQLVLTFNMAVYKGKEYAINAIALDPSTTLGGMATDVDHRYLKRVLLPAAASFMSSFGSALTSAGSQTTATGDTVVVTEVKKGYKEAAFEGMASAGDTVANFLQDEASRTKTLVRVQVGAPMGLFFLQSVTDAPKTGTMGSLSQNGQSGMGDLSSSIAKAYRDQGYGMPDVSTYPTSATAAPAGSAGTISSRPGVKTPGGTTTIY